MEARDASVVAAKKLIKEADEEEETEDDDGKFIPPVQCGVCSIFKKESLWDDKEELKEHLKTTHKMGDEEVETLIGMIVTERKGDDDGGDLQRAGPSQIKKSGKVKGRKSLEERNPPKAQPGEKTPCPKCGKKLSKASNVRNHLRKVHKLDEEEIQKLPIKTTMRRCECCGYFFGNLTVHRPRCKKKDKVFFHDF